MNRDVQVMPELDDGDSPHEASRVCWCHPTLMVGGGWIRVVHRDLAAERHSYLADRLGRDR